MANGTDMTEQSAVELATIVAALRAARAAAGRLDALTEGGLAPRVRLPIELIAVMYEAMELLPRAADSFRIAIQRTLSLATNAPPEFRAAKILGEDRAMRTP